MNQMVLEKTTIVLQLTLLTLVLAVKARNVVVQLFV